jgi:hypothetical protein
MADRQQQMNKKRKILTIVALFAFGVIIALHSLPISHFILLNPTQNTGYMETSPLIDDVRLPLFVLFIFYAGLFAVLGDNKRKE